MSICDDKEDHFDPYEIELVKIAAEIKRLGLKVRLTLDAEFAVQPFPAAPGDEIDDIENGFFRFGGTFIPVSRVDIINLDFGTNESERDLALRALTPSLEHPRFIYDRPPINNTEVEALRKLLLHKSREGKKIRTIDSVRPNMLDGTVDKEIGPIGNSTVLIPYEVGTLYLLAVLSLKNIRLIQFV